MTTSVRPGARLLHPLAVLALVVLVLNDHVLKRHQPGPLSGKLSDFAGMLLFPLLLAAAYELGVTRLDGSPPSVRRANRALVVATLATGLAFSLPEVWPPAETAYRVVFGTLGWPIQAVIALLKGSELPPLGRAHATADPTDLLALPMGGVALFIGLRRAEPVRLPEWLVRVMLFASIGGVLAESYETDSTHYELRPTAPAVELDASRPKRTFHVVVLATARGEHGEETTAHVLVETHGKLTTSIDPAPAVEVNILGSRFTGPAPSERVYTEFALSSELDFKGDCSTFDPATPCEATLDIVFNRADAGNAGGTVNIDWSLTLSANSIGGDHDERLSPPWSVNITEE